MSVSRMNVNILPNEILQYTFKRLSGSEILACGRVCRRWKEAMEGLSDQFWKGICAKEHSEIYEAAYRKARLSWYELYVSLSLWADVPIADVEINSLVVKGPALAWNIHMFQILSNGIMACPCIRGQIDWETDTFYDTIIYFDLEKLEECHRQCYDFDFVRFEENDFFVVMALKRDKNSDAVYIQVIIKSNKKSFSYGKDACTKSWSWVLYKNEIYLQCLCTEYKHLYRLKLVEQNNDFTLETDDLEYFEDYLQIQGIEMINSAQINILSTTGRIYTLINKELKLLLQIDVSSDEEFKQAIIKYGFSWQSLGIFDFCATEGPFYECCSRKSIYHLCLNYGKTVLTYDSGKCPPSIDIYFLLFDNPYDDNGVLRYQYYNKTTPSKSIDLKKIVPYTEEHILQIGVVEIQDGHMVVGSTTDHGIFVIKLDNYNVNRRSIVSDEWRETFYDPLFFKFLKMNMKTDESDSEI